MKNKSIFGGNSSRVSFSTIGLRSKCICLFIYAASISDYIASNFRITVNDELQIMWKEAVVA
jgi:hypothetical protein